MPAHPGESRSPAVRRIGNPDSGSGSRGLTWLWFFVGLAVVIAVAAGAIWFLTIRPAQSAIGGLRDAVARALGDITGQKVTVHGNTVVLEKSNIAELNLVQRKTQTVVKLESALLGSRKTLILRGDFIVKAGFDLSKPFRVEVDEASGEVRAEFPPARITSVEMKNFEVFFSDDGLINKLSPADQEMATRQMIGQARVDAERSDIKEEAETQLKRRLHDLLSNQASRILIRGEEARP